MAAIQAAKNARSAAAATLTESIRQLKKQIDSNNPSRRLLQCKLDILLPAKGDLIAKHYAYAEKAGLELDSEELKDWINPKLDEAVDLSDEVQLKIDELDSNDEYTQCALQSATDERNLRDRVDVMMIYVNDETHTSKDDADLVRSQLSQIKETLDELIKSWKTMKDLNITAVQIREVFTKEEQLKKFVFDSQLLALAFINKIDPEVDNKHSEQGIEDDKSSSRENDAMRLKHERLMNPKFSGDIRTYARFKSDFQKFVAPTYPDKEYQSYVIKHSCLYGNAKKLVENVGSIEEIWKRLETRYGDNVEIVNHVLREIEELQFSKGQFNQNMINLVDALDKGVQDLDAIGAKSEIANAYTVKLLEEKLPNSVMIRWFNKDTDGEDSNDSRSSCLLHPNGHHLTRRCYKFKAKTVEERGKVVKDTNGCKLCLSNSHVGNPCPREGEWKCNVNGCDQSHNSLLHGCTLQGIGMYVERCNAQYDEKNGPLLLIEYVDTPSGKVVAFWDNGSTLAMISKDCAMSNNLAGVHVLYDLITVGGKVTPMSTTMYELELIDREGDVHKLKVYEIEDICGEIDSTATSANSLIKFFPSITPNEIRRPRGKVDILIGMEYAGLHPQRIEANGNLILYRSMFGTGKIIGGSQGSSSLGRAVSSMVQQCALGRIVNVRIAKNTMISNIDFFSAEEFGVNVPPRCKRCQGCKDCRYETHQLSRNEQKELDVIRDNLELNPTNNRWTARYPYNSDPAVLQDNKAQVISITERTEKRLSKNKFQQKQFREQIYDLLRRGVLVEITEEDERNYNGPVFYVSTHEIFKPGSSSTPLRVVINSSLRYRGVGFNDICMKGPNSVKDLFGILLKFRTYSYALVGDLSKMYNSVYTTETEKHLRRILFRSDSSKKFKVYGPTRVMFGDKPAAAITAEAIKETANIYRYIDEDAAEKIENQTYVDDITSGADTKEDIERLKVKIPEILSKGGFKVKGFVTTGDHSKEALSLLGSGDTGRVLGVTWHPKGDTFSVKVRINMSKKIKGARVGEDLRKEQICTLIDAKLTRRLLLGFTNSCYDPYGLLSPITVQAKIELRMLFKSELGWDDPLPKDIKMKWISIMQLMKSAEDVQFKRCVKPDRAVGNPVLIMSNDGSDEAMCATAHLRWALDDGTYQCVLFASKTRVTPLRKETIPRIEIQSAVMGARLAKTIQTHSGLQFDEVVHVLDSMCTLAILQNESSALREYMGNRASEILSLTQIGQWHHVRSKLNISDLATRAGASVDDISPTSDWQNGNSWMRLPKLDWPLTQETACSIPKEELLKTNIAALSLSSYPENQLFDLSRFKGRKYTFLLRVFATLLQIGHNRCFKVNQITPAEIDYAELFCIKNSMFYTEKELLAGNLKSLGAVKNEKGIICLNSRAIESMRLHYGNEEFPILVYKDPLSYIWMMEMHNEDHSGITKTVAKSRRKFWIVKGRRLAQTIKSRCYRCRLLDKTLMEQIMAPLPTTRTKIAPSFCAISMDLFGPLVIKDTVKQRTRKKVWGVIFNCTVSRAMHLDLTEDYGTDAILQTIRRFTSLRGCPSEIYSDQGSQLISAAKDIASLTEKWDWKPVQDWAATRRINWILAPAEGQHKNGLSEALIKSVKRSVMHKITANNVLTFAQLQTALFEVANIINSRPIGIISGSDPEQPCAITPNDLILGRATSDVPQGPFDLEQSKSANKQFRYVQQLVSDWWKSWYQTVFPNLVPNYKWLQRHRNVQIGDVCLIRYGGDLRATYRLGRVQDVKLGTDGLVRTVALKYKLPHEKCFRTVDRPVQGISVIVPVEEQQGLKNGLDPQAVEFQPSSSN